MKRRLTTWFAIAAAFVLVAALRYQPGWLQTDILALAGDGGGAPALAAAQEKLNRRLQHSLLWMLVAPAGLTPGEDSARLAAATETLAQKLQASAAIENLEYRWAESGRFRNEWALLFPLRQQLLAPADRGLLQDAPEQLVQRQLAAIYGPQSGGLDLERDPFGVFRNYFSAGPDLASEVHGEIPVQRSGDQAFTLIRSTAAPTELGGSIETPLLQLRGEMQRWAREQGMELLAVGAPLHTEYAATGAQREIRLIGGLSIAAICLLSLLVFRSAGPLLLCIFAIGCGIACGTAAVVALLGRMHILAFVFGTTVTGLAIDYAFHFICNRLRGDGRDRDVLPGLLLGLLSSCLAFFALALTPFPLLRQMGLFVGFGLIGAWLTVVLLFPALLRLKARPLAFAERLALGRKRWYGASLCALLLLGMAALPRIEFADDLQLFYQPPEFLAADEQRLNGLLPSRAESSYFLVRGENWQQLLQREWRLAERLRQQQRSGALQYFEALSLRFPPPQVQRQDWALMRNFYGSATVEGFYTQLGYSEAEAKELIVELRQPFRALTLEEWLAVAGKNYRDLWLGCDDGGCTSMVRLYGLDRGLDGMMTAVEGVTPVDPPRAIAGLMSQQRDLLLQLLPLVLLVAFAVIALRTGAGRALGIIGLPLAALAGTVAALVLSGSGISLFHVAALLLIFGIGVDYAVFSHMGGGEEKSYTLLAIAMAGVTTLLGFGLLALSRTPAIADFGLTLALGATLTLLLAALYFVGAEKEKGGNR